MAGINRAVVQAINVGRSIAPNVSAVLIGDNHDEDEEVRERWQRQIPDVPLVYVESPYRALVEPLLAYLDVLDAQWPADKPLPITFVVIPEFVARHWWERCCTTSRPLVSAGRCWVEPTPSSSTSHIGAKTPTSHPSSCSGQTLDRLKARSERPKRFPLAAGETLF